MVAPTVDVHFDPVERISTPEFDEVHVVVVRPSRYEGGRKEEFWRSFVPSNSLATVATITKEALENTLPDKVTTRIYEIEDGIHASSNQLKALLEKFRSRRSGIKVICCLVGVQTAEMPRAQDIITEWQDIGATCVIGGFHISAYTAMWMGWAEDKRRNLPEPPGTMPPGFQELMDAGVILFYGEAEKTWQYAVRDILLGTPQQIYIGETPDLVSYSIPTLPDEYYESLFVGSMKPTDASRGCPHVCNFCSLINTADRTVRFRDPDKILSAIRKECENYGKASIFFVDDNFVRNPKWKELLRGIGQLRNEGYFITLMVEADLLCYKKSDFLRLLGEAGTRVQLFLGMESLNPRNLAMSGKTQNHVDEYEKLLSLCHQHGIMTLVGYIIGFPYDTVKSIMEDVKRLCALGVDQVAFFCLTHLPGSEAHLRAFLARHRMDKDESRYHTNCPAMDHPAAPDSIAMTQTEWHGAYRDAWPIFYTIRNMISVLLRLKSWASRRHQVSQFAWYRWSYKVEFSHPMATGFYRTISLADFRPGWPKPSRSRHNISELWRHLRYGYYIVHESIVFTIVLLVTLICLLFRPLLPKKQIIEENVETNLLHVIDQPLETVA